MPRGSDFVTFSRALDHARPAFDDQSSLGPTPVAEAAIHTGHWKPGRRILRRERICQPRQFVRRINAEFGQSSVNKRVKGLLKARDSTCRGLKQSGEHLIHSVEPHEPRLRHHPEVRTLSLVALRISLGVPCGPEPGEIGQRDRKSTRLNSSHVKISYAVFCLKKKKQ